MRALSQEPDEAQLGESMRVPRFRSGQAGKRLDVDVLYARHHDALLLFLVRRTADVEVALDLWAETFAQAIAGRAKFRGTTEAEAAGWLFGIARRQLALYFRRGHAERRALDRLGLERPPADVELLAEIEQRARLDVLRAELRFALETLSEPVREAVRLRVVDELPYAEVAVSLDISEQAARARVSRGLSALADVLDSPRVQEVYAS
jgi:RNA polymerase sigma factor (sigma-70 family)